MRFTRMLFAAVLLVMSLLPVAATTGAPLYAAWKATASIPLPRLTSGELRVDPVVDPGTWQMQPDGTYVLAQTFSLTLVGTNLEPTLTVIPGAAQGASVAYTLTNQHGDVLATSSGQAITLGAAQLDGVTTLSVTAVAHRADKFAPTTLPSTALNVRQVDADWGYTSAPLNSVELPADRARILRAASAMFGSYAIDELGTLWAWGRNDSGQVGDGTTMERTRPVNVSAATGLGPFSSVAGGTGHTVALGQDGKLWAWGVGTNGELGNGANTSSLTPVPVTMSADMGKIVTLKSNQQLNYVIDENRVLWGWGINTIKPLADGGDNTVSSPRPVRKHASMAGVVDVAVGSGHVLVLDDAGKVFAWGSNGAGQSGTNLMAGGSRQVLGPVLSGAGLGTVKAVAAGRNSSYALDDQGAVWSWGANDSGQLGNNATSLRATPGRVTVPAGMGKIVAIAAGNENAYALNEVGEVWAWGYSPLGQLGNGAYEGSLVPVRVSTRTGMGRVVSIASAYDTAFAVDESGALWAWGSGYWAELGDGTNTRKSEPVRVSDTTGMGPVWSK